jgi:hypothetical protein
VPPDLLADLRLHKREMLALLTEPADHVADPWLEPLPSRLASPPPPSTWAAIE